MTFKNKLQACIKQPYFWLGLILLAGSIVRLAALDRYPLGLHQDEAYSAYNAYSIMNYGIDSYGYTRPVYYTVWGSGMSVLYSYLTMPFFALFGISTITIRLPQAILGCISVLTAYGLGRELLNQKFGLLFAAFLAINPWHIQQSRFGLDANLAVPMMLFAVYFLCRYLNGKSNHIWLSAFFFGLTLYCYAITWPLIPGFLLLCMLNFRHRIQWNRTLLGAILLLFLMALPLILFLAVNFGWLPEIRTGLFSIPKLPKIRTDEFSLGKLKAGFFWMIAMLWNQHDDIWWITDSTVGSYYYISTPFILIGLICHIRILYRRIRHKEPLPLHFLMALWFFSMFLMGCTIDAAKYYKVNCLHIPIIFYSVYGITAVWKLWQGIWLKRLILAAYGGLFCYFLYAQLTLPVDYSAFGNPLMSHMLWNEYEQAIDYAESLTDGPITIYGLNYANFMLYKRISPYEYLETVSYDGNDPAFRTVTRIGRYHFTRPETQDPTMVYILPNMTQDSFHKEGYTVEPVGRCYCVAYKK